MKALNTFCFFLTVLCGFSQSTSDNTSLRNSNACEVFNVPFYEDFEENSATLECWTVIDKNKDDVTWRFTYPSDAGQPTLVASLRTGDTSLINDDYLVTPTINLTGKEQLRFLYSARHWSDTNNFQVLLSTTGIGLTTFTDTIVPLMLVSHGWYYKELIVNLSDYTGDVNIAFHVPPGEVGGSYLYIEDVHVETIPSCFEPTNLTASNITGNSAQLSWQTPSGMSAWDIEYGATSFTPSGIPIDTAISNPHTITGLTPTASYDYYVRANCDTNGFSDWVGPFTFKTECGIFYAPLSEDFEENSSTEYCWTILDNNNDGQRWNTDYFHASANSFTAGFYNNINDGTNDDYLISPSLLLTGNEQLRFRYAIKDLFFPNDFQVLLSTTGITPSDFTDTIVPYTIADDEAYVQLTIDLSAFTGNANIAFHVPPSDIEGWYLMIDDVEILTDPDFISESLQTPIEFQIMPNPNNGRFALKVNSHNSETLSLKIVDLQGQLIFNKQYDYSVGKLTQEIDLSQFSHGTYLVIVNSDNGTSTQRLIKQ
jgi:hypothetical protein